MLQKSGFVVFRKNYNDLETNSFIVLYKNSIDTNLITNFIKFLKV